MKWTQIARLLTNLVVTFAIFTAATASADLVWSDDFESPAAGSLPNGGGYPGGWWHRQVTAPDEIVLTNSQAASGQQFCYLNDADGEIDSRIRLSAWDLSGVLDNECWIQFTMKHLTPYTNDWGKQWSANAVYPWKSGNTYNVQMLFRTVGSTYRVYWEDYDGRTEILTGLNVGAGGPWIEYLFGTTVTNVNTGSGVVTIFHRNAGARRWILDVDRAPFVSKTSYTAGSPFPGFDMVTFTGQGSRYLDDVSIYDAVPPPQGTVILIQ